MIRIERIDFHRPSSNKMEEGIRITDDELERSIIVDRDFNPIVNAVYGIYRKEIAIIKELDTTIIDNNADNTNAK